MARSVSSPCDASWVTYVHLPEPEGYECHLCETSGKDDDGDECLYCDGTGMREADHDDYVWRWEDFVGNLRATFAAAFPSLYDSDEWLGGEDHALLENRHAYIGVSEYCELVSVWCVPRGDYYGNAPTGLAERWCKSIEPRASALLDTFADRLTKVGTFSNGEAVYQRAAPLEQTA